MNKMCYVAARAPRPGQVKTRLGAVIGHQAAAGLYDAFLKDIAARFARVSFPVSWYVTPGDWSDRPHVMQGEGDWGQRQAQLFREAAARGEERVVLIASDSPQIDIATIHEAFGELDHHDLVLGPLDDGGYYLIGMRGWHDIFTGVEMTTATAMRDLLDGASALGLTVALTEPLFAIEEVGDLEQLTPIARTRDDMRHTRRALASLRAGVAA